MAYQGRFESLLFELLYMKYKFLSIFFHDNSYRNFRACILCAGFKIEQYSIVG